MIQKDVLFADMGVTSAIVRDKHCKDVTRTVTDEIDLSIILVLTERMRQDTGSSGLIFVVLS